MACTRTILNTLDWARTKPTLTKALGNPVTGLGGNAIPLAIANKVIQEILEEPFAWKWNRRVPAPFVTNGLQQDYSTSITDLGWIENATRTQINNPEFPSPSDPNYVIRGVEVVRELMPTSAQGIVQQLSWVPNSIAICGTWAPNITFTDPSTLQQMPIQPFTQIKDPNGNIQVLTQFGKTGGNPPVWNTTKNQITQDGTCQWTMADPDGITWRLSPRPPESGIVYQLQPYYQKTPPLFTSVGQLWTIPDEERHIYEAGFMAYAWDAAEEDARFEKNYALFKMEIKEALRAADREQESFGMYPGRSLTGIVGTITRGDEQYPPGLFSNT